MKNTGVFLSLGFLLILSSVHADKDFDDFVSRWKLDKGLKCIHRDVEKLGAQTKPKPGEPNFQGSRSTCFFLQQGAHMVQVFKWPAFNEFRAVYFVRGKPPNTPLFTEGDKIKECQTWSDMDSSSQPQWVKSKDTGEVVRKLKNHCFFKRITEDHVTYKYVFKVTHYPQKGKKSAYFESKRILFLIPNKKNYFIANNEQELEKICTRCIAGGGFSETPLVKGNNIEELLRKASEKYYG